MWRRHGRYRGICSLGGCTIAAADVVHNEPFHIAAPIINAAADANVGASIATLALAIERPQGAPPI
jgi:hypothetical protein